MEKKTKKNREQFSTLAPFSRKSLGQRSVEDVQQGAVNNGALVFHWETSPAADFHTVAAMEMNDFEV